MALKKYPQVEETKTIESYDELRRNTIKWLIKSWYESINPYIKKIFWKIDLKKYKWTKELLVIPNESLFDESVNKATSLMLKIESDNNIILTKNDLKLVWVKLFLEYKKANTHNKVWRKRKWWDNKSNLELNIFDKDEVNRWLYSLENSLSSSFSNIKISVGEVEKPKWAIEIKNINELITKYDITDEEFEQVINQLLEYKFKEVTWIVITVWAFLYFISAVTAWVIF